MAISMINDLSSLINGHIEDREVLFEYLNRIEALIDVTRCEGFLDCTEDILHTYSTALSDIVLFAKEKCKNSLDALTALPLEEL